MSSPTLSFTSGVFTRSIMAIGYAAVVWAAVRAIEQSSSEPLAAPMASAPTAEHRTHIDLTATYAVSAWTVRINGALVEPDKSTANAWSAEVIAADTLDIFVDAARNDALASEPSAIQVRVKTDAVSRSESLWGAGAVTGTARMSLELAP